MDVLIFRPGAIGDTLMLLPPLNHLAGNAHITVVGRKPGLNFIRNCVNRSMDFEGPGWHRLFLETPSRNALPVAAADLVVAFLNDEAGCIRRNLNAYFPDASVYLFRSRPPAGKDVHMVRYVSECLSAAGLPIDPKRTFENARKYPTIIQEQEWGPRNKVVIHPGSGSPRKNHPPAFWRSLIKAFVQKPEFRSLIPAVLLGPAEQPMRAYFMKNSGSPRIELHLCSDKEALTALLGCASLYMGHDSGITHYAAMLGIPTIALFKKDTVGQWAPLGPFVSVIQSNIHRLSLIESTLEAAKDLTN